MKKKFDSVWDAIENTPAEAANMKARAALMREVAGWIQRRGLTQKEAAHALGITQPRVSDLMRGKIDLFGVDALINMLAVAGLGVEVKIKKASVKTTASKTPARERVAA